MTDVRTGNAGGAGSPGSAARPGTPRLLRELNDRAALDLLISSGPLTRAEIGEQTGLSKVTASQLLSRLEERGLVEVVGARAGGRGPNAALYAVVPSAAYVVGLVNGPAKVVAGIADITGANVAEVVVDAEAGDPVAVVHGAIERACDSAGIGIDQLRACVVGTPGVVDPRTGDVRFAFDLPAWHEGVLAELAADLRIPVTIENDVNLAALAEHVYGAARDLDDFALLWFSRGLGLAVMLGGRLHRGAAGGAGEIGYLPVPGVPVAEDVTESVSWGKPALAGGLGALLGADAVHALAESAGVDAPTAVECVGEAARADAGQDRARAEEAGAFLDSLATRLAYGVASVNTVLDPGLVVLTGDVGLAGGERLASRVEQAVTRICPTSARVVASQVEGNPVLRGAILAALGPARDAVFS